MSAPTPARTRVMLATDASESARRAEDWVSRLRWAEPPLLEVVTVAGRGLRRVGWSMEGDREIITQALESLRRGELRAAEAVANEAGERLQRAGLTVRTWARQGDTREELLSAIEADPPDLVVVGPRGRSRVATMLLGSVTHELVAYSPCPVLVARATPTEEGPLPRHVLLVVDGTRATQHVVEWLERSGWLAGGRLTIVALMGEEAGLERDEPALVEEISRLVEEDAAAMLERLAGPLIERGAAVDLTVVSGHPLQATLDAAASRGADLVAVARTLRRPGRDGFAEKIARYSPVSVLVVPVL